MIMLCLNNLSSYYSNKDEKKLIIEEVKNKIISVNK